MNGTGRLLELPVLWTTVAVAWFQAIPWSSLAACAALIYTALRILQLFTGWPKGRTK